MKTNGIPLRELKPGQRATITHVGGDRAVRRRYMEMGFVRGEQVLVERIAPLGDPIEYLVKGYHLSLRQKDAEQIFVQLVNEGGNE
jgi:Fe2+ transport system protein FeoA